MIGVLGINYESAPLQVREGFSLQGQQIIDLVTHFKNDTGFSGMVVLATCNRAEFYFQMQDAPREKAFRLMLDELMQFCGIEEARDSYFYFKLGNDAFKHLFHVVAGANSMVLGEDQIVGQVKEALQFSTSNNLADSELNRLFIKALEANKKIRTQTKINQGAFSVSYAGVEKCMQVFEDITACKILVVGTGETGTLTLKNLLKKGCSNVVVTNRTPEKAEAVAAEYQVDTAPFHELTEHLEESDIVLVSTGSQVPVINREDILDSHARRADRTQLFIDLSVPRNVDPAVASIENTIVYDMDHLQGIVNANQEKRRQLISEMDEIIDRYLEEFNEWLSSRNLGQVIATLKSNFNSINQNELEGFKKAKKADDELLDDYGDHLSEKYARLLIRNIKEVTQNGKDMEAVKMLNNLFQLH